MVIERDYTPPELAKLKGMQASKIIAWIRAGELRATNFATRRTGRPRWRIKLADWLAFEESRAARPRCKPARKSKAATPHVIEFFK